jgi:hypothetical protein
LGGICARAIIDVDKIQSNGGVADAHLPWPRLADLDLFPDQNFGTAGFVKTDGVRHGMLLRVN